MLLGTVLESAGRHPTAVSSHATSSTTIVQPEPSSAQPATPSEASGRTDSNAMAVTDALASTNAVASAPVATVFPTAVFEQHSHTSQRHYRRRRKQKPSLRVRLWVIVCSHLRKSTCEFFSAVESGRVEQVAGMVSATPAMLLRTRPGTQWTAAHLAAEHGHFSMVAALFSAAEVLDSESEVRTGMFCQAIPGRVRFVRQMINARTDKNLTALMLACKRGHPSTTAFLMAKGSDPCIADREGAKMAIHYASLYGHWPCVHVMLEERWTVNTSSGPKPLNSAVVRDAHGMHLYVDARTCAGLTPLHMAAWAGHIEVAKILLKHNAGLNPQTVLSSPSTSSVLPGSTPMHLAARKNRIHVVKALLLSYMERKARCEATGTLPEADPRTIEDAHGNYAVMHAIARGNNNMAALLDAGASLEVLLVNEGAHLGQFPKLATLAMGVLRKSLLRQLDAMLDDMPDVRKNKSMDNWSIGDLAMTPTVAQGGNELLTEAAVCQFDSTTGASAELSPHQNDHAMDGGLGSAAGSCKGCVMPQHKKAAPRSLADVGDRSIESFLDDNSDCGSEDHSNLCGICMEAAVSVQLTECEHSMCASCAKKLLLAGTFSACQCPFCRTYIHGFKPCAIAKHHW